MNIKTIKQNYSWLNNFQKKGAGTPAYTRFINRWLGKILTSVLACFNISPNVISITSSIITIITFFLFFMVTSFWQSFILVILLYFAYALDSADGQLARLLNKQSKSGEWLDHTLDAIKIPLSQGTAIFLIVAHKFPEKSVLFFYLIILSLACANFLSGILKSKLFPNYSSTSVQISEKHNIIRSFITLPLDYGVFISLYIFSFKPDWFTLVYNIWGIIFIIFSVT